MMQERRLSTLERAFQLAREGSETTIEQIRRTLHNEKHDGVDQHLSGATIKKQLIAAIAARKSG